MATEVVVGSTRKNLKVTIVDEENQPIDITLGDVRLQGTSPDLPGVTLDEVGTIYDGPNGVARWTQIGGFVTTNELGAKDSATFNCRVKLELGLLVDWGPLFQMTYYKQPLS